MNANDAAVIAIQMLQKSNALNPNNQSPVYSFCIKDRTLVSRSNLVALLLDSTSGRYAKEWCVKALMDTKDDFDRSLSWLSMNAPHKALPPK